MNKSCVKGLKDENTSSEYLVKNPASNNLYSKRLTELINEAERLLYKLLDYSLSSLTMKPHEFEKNCLSFC